MSPMRLDETGCEPPNVISFSMPPPMRRLGYADARILIFPFLEP